MGGKSSSSSSSSNTQTTENYDQRVAVEKDGIGIGAGATVDVVATDYGVIEGAAKILQQGLSVAGDVVTQVTDSFAGVVKDNNAVLSEQMRSDTTEISVLVVKLFGGIAAGLMVVWFLVRRK